MASGSNSSSSGIGVLGLLGVVFVTLKLCGVIHWSWWLVTLPFWGGIAFILAILLVVLVMAGINEAALEIKVLATNISPGNGQKEGQIWHLESSKRTNQSR